MEEQEQQQPQNEVQEEQNVQTEPTPLSTPPSHKKLIIGIVAGFVLVVVGMAGAYFVLQPKSESAEEENTEITNTIKVPGPLDDITFEEDQAMNDAVEEPNVPDGWKTYMNEKYGFEFQYPVEFITYIGFSEGEPIEANSVSEKFQIARNNTLLRNGESLTIGIEVITNTSFTSKEWLNENKENYSDIDEIKFIRDSKFAGKNVVELEGGGNIGSVYKLYVISANDYLLVITQANDQSLEKILSTFKFIEPQVSENISLSIEKIDEYGVKLATWGEKHSVLIRINNEYINSIIFNTGLTQTVWYENELEQSRTNFFSLIENSSCNLSELDTYITNLDLSISSETLSKDLICLGNFTFSPNWFSL